eukprot:964958-Karenia_brevis.AAC.1
MVGGCGGLVTRAVTQKEYCREVAFEWLNPSQPSPPSSVLSSSFPGGIVTRAALARYKRCPNC